jgi:hypothetical protein
MLPGALVASLRGHLDRVRKVHAQDLSPKKALDQSIHPRARKTPSRRVYPPASRQGSSHAGGNRQACVLSHLPALLRHAPLGGRSGHPHRSEAPRTRRPQNHVGLHTRIESRARGRPEPARSTMTACAPVAYTVPRNPLCSAPPDMATSRTGVLGHEMPALRVAVSAYIHGRSRPNRALTWVGRIRVTPLTTAHPNIAGMAGTGEIST